MGPGCLIRNSGRKSEIGWTKAWDIERQDWEIQIKLFKVTKLISEVMEPISMLIWWQLSDKFHELMGYCETMSKLVCGAGKRVRAIHMKMTYRSAHIVIYV